MVVRRISQKQRQADRNNAIKEVHGSMKDGRAKDDILRDIMNLLPHFSLSAAEKLYKEAFIKLDSDEQIEVLKAQKRVKLRKEANLERELEKVTIPRK